MHKLKYKNSSFFVVLWQIHVHECNRLGVFSTTNNVLNVPIELINQSAKGLGAMWFSLSTPRSLIEAMDL